MAKFGGTYSVDINKWFLRYRKLKNGTYKVFHCDTIFSNLIANLIDEHHFKYVKLLVINSELPPNISFGIVTSVRLDKEAKTLPKIENLKSIETVNVTSDFESLELLRKFVALKNLGFVFSGIRRKN